ncbi:hypothetical protein GQ607_009558 [Colletotrichum asianum]|uniref:Uncharacterized protein n=1 Tax=Colletotrichum asianum TaxID=702518 RepID=A0A8H3WAK0_9PEZI|nr:hypothetical protein GQ607_009558 [Colletotrichum asianum]
MMRLNEVKSGQVKGRRRS